MNPPGSSRRVSGCSTMNLMNIRYYIDPQTELPHIYGHQEKVDMKQSTFPEGWDETRVRSVLAHYESQTEDEAVAEDEAAFSAPDQTMMEIPRELVPAVRELIARHKAA